MLSQLLLFQLSHQRVDEFEHDLVDGQVQRLLSIQSTFFSFSIFLNFIPWSQLSSTRQN